MVPRFRTRLSSRSRRVAWDIASPGGRVPGCWMTCPALRCGCLAPAWGWQSLSPDEDAHTRGGEDVSATSAQPAPHARPHEHRAGRAPSAASAWRSPPALVLWSGGNDAKLVVQWTGIPGRVHRACASVPGSEAGVARSTPERGRHTATMVGLRHTEVGEVRVVPGARSTDDGSARLGNVRPIP